MDFSHKAPNGPENEIDIIRRLANLEKHILNLVIPINNITEALTDRGFLERLTQSLKTPIKIDDHSLKQNIFDLRNLTKSLSEDLKDLDLRKIVGSEIKKLDVNQTYGEIKFIGKALHEINQRLDKIESNGITNKLQVYLSVDGYEMVRKSKEKLPDEKPDNPDKYVEDLLNTLTEREKQSVIHRIGLLGEKKKTYIQMEKIFKVTRERIRQIYAKAIRKCRHPSKKKYVDLITHKELRKEITG